MASQKSTVKKTTMGKMTNKKSSSMKTTSSSKSKPQQTIAASNDIKKKTPSRLSSLQEKLLQERERLLKEISVKRSPGEVSSHGDLVDQSANFSEQETMLGLAEHDRQLLKDLEYALAMIQEGTYGICSMCGDEIPEARLMAMPTAKFCLKCQSKSERRY